MTSHCIEKLPHSCGSSDALQVFEEDGVYSAYCFACNIYVPDPYGDETFSDKPRPKIHIKSPEQIQAEIDEISALPARTLAKRHLNKTTLDYFGVKVGLSEEDGSTIASVFYPYTTNGTLTGYKCDLVESKKRFAIGNIKNAQMFGWEKALASGNQRLYITEGEADALTVYQVLKKRTLAGKEEWRDIEPAVVSLVHGASSARNALIDHANALRSNFKEIVLVFDNDDAGRKAVEAAKKVNSTVVVVQVPTGKDANECLVQGHEKALTNSLIFKMEQPKNTRIVDIDDFFEEALKPIPEGLSFPWTKLTKLTRGLRWGEVYYIGAGVKMGKSDLLNALAVWFAIEHDLNILLAKPEEGATWTAKHLYGKAAGKILYDSEREYDEADVIRGKERIANRIHLIQQYQQLDWSVLKQDILWSIRTHKTKLVFIDPITNLTLGISASEANTILGQVAQAAAILAKEEDIAIMFFAHLNSPDSGPPHEMGGRIYSNQFTGSRSMMRSCQYMLGLEGNKDAMLSKEQQNMRSLVMLEDRQYGSSGVVRLYWDENTGLFNEIKED